MPFRVGDRVRVKTWEELLRLGELDSIGGIRHSYLYFNREMRQYCGREFTVEYVGADTYFLAEVGWNWSDWMLEPADPNEIHVGDRVKVKSKARLIREGNHGGFVSDMKHLYGMEGVVIGVDGNLITLDNPWFSRHSDGRPALGHWAILKNQVIKIED